MSDDMEDTRAFVRHLFGGPHPPRDIVPGEGLTRDALLEQNAAAGTTRTVFIPGTVMEDVDGAPIGMTEGRYETVIVGASVVTEAQVTAAGLTSDDLPNLHITERKDKP